MNARIVRIGNSQGLRLSKELLTHYNLEEGSEVQIEERREGILLRPASQRAYKLPWDQAYEEMATEAAENAEWADWDGVAGDGSAHESAHETDD